MRPEVEVVVLVEVVVKVARHCGSGHVSSTGAEVSPPDSFSTLESKSFIAANVFSIVLAAMHNLPDGRKINVGVLGATGTVGQRFILLLADHPYFVVAALGASQRSAGKPYSNATAWKQSKPIPSAIRDMVVSECKPELFAQCAIVFSGLDAEVAGDIGASLYPSSSCPKCQSDLLAFP